MTAWQNSKGVIVDGGISTREELGSKSLIMDWQSQHNKKWIRVVAFLVIICFINQDIIWAQGGTPLWTKGQNGSFSVKTPTPVNGGINVPKDVAITKEVYTGRSDKTIINIQDAHSSLGAQESIVSILDSLVTNYDLKLVAIEGSTGYIDTSLLRTFPNEKIRNKAAQHLMERGRMSAGEFFSVTSDKEIALYGIEEMKLYNENVEQFKRMQELNESVKSDIFALTSTLKVLQEKIYTKELRILDSNSVLHRDGRITFTDRWVLVNDLAVKYGLDYKKYDNLSRLVESLDLEKGIDFEKANKERDALIDVLSKTLSKTELEGLVLKSLAFKTHKISQAEYYVFLQELAQRNGVDPEPYANLIRYTEYIAIYDSIDLIEIFREVKEFEDSIKEKMFTNDDQRKLYKFSQCIEFIKDLFEIKLANGDFNYLEANLATCNAESLADFIKEASAKYNVVIGDGYDLGKIFGSIPEAMDFYTTAEKRNSAILSNTVKRMTESGQSVAAVITGGYHTKGLTELIKQKHTSYIVILPKFDASKGERPYVAILTNKKAPYERLLSSGQYYLATSAYFEGLSSMAATGKDGHELTAEYGEVFAEAMVMYLAKETDMARAAEKFKARLKIRSEREKVQRETVELVNMWESTYTSFYEDKKDKLPEGFTPLTPENFRKFLISVAQTIDVDIAAGATEEARGQRLEAIKAIEERLSAVEAKVGIADPAAVSEYIDKNHKDILDALAVKMGGKTAVTETEFDEKLAAYLRAKKMDIKIADLRKDSNAKMMLDLLKEALDKRLQPAPAAPAKAKAVSYEARLAEVKRMVADNIAAMPAPARDNINGLIGRLAQEFDGEDDSAILREYLDIVKNFNRTGTGPDAKGLCEGDPWEVPAAYKNDLINNLYTTYLLGLDEMSMPGASETIAARFSRLDRRVRTVERVLSWDQTTYNKAFAAASRSYITTDPLVHNAANFRYIVHVIRDSAVAGNPMLEGDGAHKDVILSASLVDQDHQKMFAANSPALMLELDNDMAVLGAKPTDSFSGSMGTREDIEAKREARSNGTLQVPSAETILSQTGTRHNEVVVDGRQVKRVAGVILRNGKGEDDPQNAPFTKFARENNLPVLRYVDGKIVSAPRVVVGVKGSDYDEFAGTYIFHARPTTKLVTFLKPLKDKLGIKTSVVFVRNGRESAALDLTDGTSILKMTGIMLDMGIAKGSDQNTFYLDPNPFTVRFTMEGGTEFERSEALKLLGEIVANGRLTKTDNSGKSIVITMRYGIEDKDEGQPAFSQGEEAFLETYADIILKAEESKKPAPAPGKIELTEADFQKRLADSSARTAELEKSIIARGGQAAEFINRIREQTVGTAELPGLNNRDMITSPEFGMNAMKASYRGGEMARGSYLDMAPTDKWDIAGNKLGAYHAYLEMLEEGELTIDVDNRKMVLDAALQAFVVSSLFKTGAVGSAAAVDGTVEEITGLTTLRTALTGLKTRVDAGTISVEDTMLELQRIRREFGAELMLRDDIRGLEISIKLALAKSAAEMEKLIRSIETVEEAKAVAAAKILFFRIGPQDLTAEEIQALAKSNFKLQARRDGIFFVVAPAAPSSGVTLYALPPQVTIPVVAALVVGFFLIKFTVATLAVFGIVAAVAGLVYYRHGMFLHIRTLKAAGTNGRMRAERAERANTMRARVALALSALMIVGIIFVKNITATPEAVTPAAPTAQVQTGELKTQLEGVKVLPTERAATKAATITVEAKFQEIIRTQFAEELKSDFSEKREVFMDTMFPGPGVRGRISAIDNFMDQNWDSILAASDDYIKGKPDRTLQQALWVLKQSMPEVYEILRSKDTKIRFGNIDALGWVARARMRGSYGPAYVQVSSQFYKKGNGSPTVIASILAHEGTHVGQGPETFMQFVGETLGDWQELFRSFVDALPRKEVPAFENTTKFWKNAVNVSPQTGDIFGDRFGMLGMAYKGSSFFRGIVSFAVWASLIGLVAGIYDMVKKYRAAERLRADDARRAVRGRGPRLYGMEPFGAILAFGSLPTWIATALVIIAAGYGVYRYRDSIAGLFGKREAVAPAAPKKKTVAQEAEDALKGFQAGKKTTTTIPATAVKKGAEEAPIKIEDEDEFADRKELTDADKKKAAQVAQAELNKARAILNALVEAANKAIKAGKFGDYGDLYAAAIMDIETCYDKIAAIQDETDVDLAAFGVQVDKTKQGIDAMLEKANSSEIKRRADKRRQEAVQKQEGRPSPVRTYAADIGRGRTLPVIAAGKVDAKGVTLDSLAAVKYVQVIRELVMDILQVRPDIKGFDLEIVQGSGNALKAHWDTKKLEIDSIILDVLLDAKERYSPEVFSAIGKWIVDHDMRHLLVHQEISGRGPPENYNIEELANTIIDIRDFLLMSPEAQAALMTIFDAREDNGIATENFHTTLLEAKRRFDAKVARGMNPGPAAKSTALSMLKQTIDYYDLDVTATSIQARVRLAYGMIDRAERAEFLTSIGADLNLKYVQALINSKVDLEQRAQFLKANGLPVTAANLRMSGAKIIASRPAAPKEPERAALTGLSVAEQAILTESGFPEFRKGQLEAMRALKDGIFAELRTGGGKTLTLAGAALSQYKENGRRVLLATHQEDLTIQAMEKNKVGEMLSRRGAVTGFIIPDAEGNEIAVIFENGLRRTATVEEAYKNCAIIYAEWNRFVHRHMNEKLGSMEPAMNAGTEEAKNKYFMLFDEADLMLVFGAATPAIISGKAAADSDMQIEVRRVADQVAEDLLKDAAAKKKNVLVLEGTKEIYMTRSGINQARAAMNALVARSPELADIVAANWEIFMVQALQAREYYQSGRDYQLTSDGSVRVVHFGKPQPKGMTFGEGLQQAIEIMAKAPQISPVSTTGMSMTVGQFLTSSGIISDYAGASGTMERDRLKSIYPTKDVKDIAGITAKLDTTAGHRGFATQGDKWEVLLVSLREKTAANQPVLIKAESDSEAASLKKFLEERFAAEIAERGLIINEALGTNEEGFADALEIAGYANVITITTNIAHRGIDITIKGRTLNADRKTEGPEVPPIGKDAPGLHVISVYLDEAEAFELQTQGRADRGANQGSWEGIFSMDEKAFVEHAELLNQEIYALRRAIRQGAKSADIEMLIGEIRSKIVSEQNRNDSLRREYEDRVFEFQKDLLIYTNREEFIKLLVEMRALEGLQASLRPGETLGEKIDKMLSITTPKLIAELEAFQTEQQRIRNRLNYLAGLSRTGVTGSLNKFNKELENLKLVARSFESRVDAVNKFVTAIVANEMGDAIAGVPEAAKPSLRERIWSRGVQAIVATLLTIGVGYAFAKYGVRPLIDIALEPLLGLFAAHPLVAGLAAMIILIPAIYLHQIFSKKIATPVPGEPEQEFLLFTAGLGDGNLFKSFIKSVSIVALQLLAGPGLYAAGGTFIAVVAHPVIAVCGIPAMPIALGTAFLALAANIALIVMYRGKLKTVEDVTPTRAQSSLNAFGRGLIISIGVFFALQISGGALTATAVSIGIVAVTAFATSRISKRFESRQDRVSRYTGVALGVIGAAAFIAISSIVGTSALFSSMNVMALLAVPTAALGIAMFVLQTIQARQIAGEARLAKQGVVRAFLESYIPSSRNIMMYGTAIPMAYLYFSNNLSPLIPAVIVVLATLLIYRYNVDIQKRLGTTLSRAFSAMTVQVVALSAGATPTFAYPQVAYPAQLQKEIAASQASDEAYQAAINNIKEYSPEQLAGLERLARNADRAFNELVAKGLAFTTTPVSAATSAEKKAAEERAPPATQAAVEKAAPTTAPAAT
ncbi:MAG: hypothetical protein WCT15_01855, partial [Candidatus Omnitrophota bacterium]